MGKTLFGVVYDAHTLAIRRIIVPDDDAELSRHVRPGEALVTRQLILGTHTINDAIDLVRAKTGREPPLMRDVHIADQISRDMNGGKLRVI